MLDCGPSGIVPLFVEFPLLPPPATAAVLVAVVRTEARDDVVVVLVLEQANSSLPLLQSLDPSHSRSSSMQHLRVCKLRHQNKRISAYV